MKFINSTDAMFTIGNKELDSAPDLGDTIVCPICHMRHPVEYGEEVHSDGTKTPDTYLAFYTCGKESYLCGLNGKSTMNR
jgi:hypothetical protein